jgi:hypothetical protein
MENIIQPEIINDEFHTALNKYAKRHDLKTFLEIGSSSGGGSTDAFVTGIKERINTSDVRLFCMEVSRTRFKALLNHYLADDFVRCFNISSIPANELPTEMEVIHFYNSIQTNLNNYPLETVLEWLHQDIEYIKKSGSDANGIRLIKKTNQILNFDMVLIDGSEFTGERELYNTIGAKVIALDDVNTFKCWNAFQTLLNTSNYELKEHNFTLRNGYAVFEKKF